MCIAPQQIKDTTGVSVYNYLTVPCGKCHECRSARSAAWAFRLEQEDKIHSETHFVTLTYSDENLLLADDGPTLYKPHLQKFWKRLRKNSQRKIKYYSCGEYGGITQRPHYHAIVFGAKADDIEANWKAGDVHFGDVNRASIRYVTNYMCKSSVTHFGDKVPEFALMSKGLGKNYLSAEMIQWHENNLANYVVNLGGTIQALPRYYKDRIFDENQRRKFGIEHMAKLDLQKMDIIEKIGFADYEQSVVEQKQQLIRSANYKQSQRNKL